MNELLDASLLHGPLPITLWLLGAAAIIFLVARRSRRWWLFALASAVAAAVLSFAVVWAAIHVFFWWSEDLPPVVTWSLSAALWALILGCTTALGGLRRPPASRTTAARRLLSLGAMALVLLVSGGQVNAYFGEYPTVGSLLGRQPTAQAIPVPAQQHALDSRFRASPVGRDWKAPEGLPAKGTLISANIPGTLSGFTARDAIVYLPPAYSAVERPILPVLVLISGQPGSPQSWLRSTNLIYDLDEYAARHDGLAPLVVMPDPNGSDQGNTMCMDSKVAKADTYMSRDVPNWINSHLDADTNPDHWAVGGFSYGATCSLQMVTRHPKLFHTFMAIAPEREPSLAADRTVTVDLAFGGDAVAFNALLPLTLMAEHHYPNTRGWFATGSSDTTYAANVTVLEAAAHRAGMRTQSASFPGGHSWAVANEALQPGLKFVYSRIGLP